MLTPFRGVVGLTGCLMTMLGMAPLHDWSGGGGTVPRTDSPDPKPDDE